MKPKPSAAPAPRLRANAPNPALNEARPAAFSSRSASPPLSEADEIAGMLAPGRAREADLQAPFNPATMASQFPGPRKPVSGQRDPWFFRRTIIPILLTFGVILWVWGILLVTSGQNNALADLFPSWTPFVLFGMAAVFFVLGIANIMSLKNAK